MAKHKSNLKTALAHLEEIQAQRDAEERRKQEEENRKCRELELEEEKRTRVLAEQRKKEHELAERQKLVKLQKDCSNLYSWVVYYDNYTMECGIVWADSFEDACQFIKKDYPNGKNYIINPVKSNKRVVRIVEYIE